MPEAIQKRAARALQERVFPGCVIGIVRRDETRSVFPCGTLSYRDDRVGEDTVYDVASVTKSIPLASVAALMIANGTLRLDDLVVRHVPELRNDHGATVEDLLRYRVHGVQMSTLAHETFEEIRTRVLEHGFHAPPGESAYTNLPAYLLGLIVERLTGERLAALAHKQFFEPLGMTNTTFFPSAPDCAPTEIDGRGEVRGLPHDESAYVFAKARRSAGHAGLFSTVPDLLHFLEALMSGRFPEIVEFAERGLGWQLYHPSFMGTYAGPRTFGKTGFTGCSVVCDRERGIGLVILSNRTYPKRPADAASPSSGINVFRADIADLVFRAL